MFILRSVHDFQIEADAQNVQRVTNIEIGNQYCVFLKDESLEYKAVFGDDLDLFERSWAVIHQKDWPLILLKSDDLNKYSYYIMTDSGKTFERL